MLRAGATIGVRLATNIIDSSKGESALPRGTFDSVRLLCPVRSPLGNFSRCLPTFAIEPVYSIWSRAQRAGLLVWTAWVSSRTGGPMDFKQIR